MARYYIDSAEAGAADYQKAIEMACILASNNKAIMRIALVTPTKNHGFFNGVFSALNIKELEKGQSISISSCPRRIVSTSRQSYKGSNTPFEVVITFGLNANDVLLLEESSQSIIDIIAIQSPGILLHKWVQTWNPVDIHTMQPVLAAPAAPSCPVQMALQQLNRIANTRVHSFGTTDEESAKTYARALHHGEAVAIDPIDVFAYARGQLNYTVGTAEFMEQLIDKLNTNVRFKGGAQNSMSALYQKWLSQCP
jgi:hypothetical protein